MASARDDYVTVLPADSDADADTESAFESWRESLKTAQAQGTLRVQRVPLDENENPQWNGKAVSELFTAPIDRYTFEEIISKIKRDYIRPNENKIAVRLMGAQAGERGLKFNRLVVVERENTAHATGASNAPGDILRAVQEMNAQNLQMMRSFVQEMIANRPIPTTPAFDPMQMTMQMLTAMGGFMAAMNKSAAPVASTPGTSLKEMVETMTMLKGLSDEFGGNGGGSDEGGAAAIIKAATPLAVPMLQALTEASKTVRVSRAQQIRRPPPQPVEARTVPRPAQQPPRVNPAPRQSAPQSADTGAASVEGNEVLDMIRPHLGTLCDLATEKADPAQVAEMVLDFVPEKFDQQLSQMVSSEKFVQHLRLLNPRVSDHVEWFEQVRLALVASYEEDAGDGEEPAPPEAAPGALTA